MLFSINCFIFIILLTYILFFLLVHPTIGYTGLGYNCDETLVADGHQPTV